MNLTYLYVGLVAGLMGPFMGVSAVIIGTRYVLTSRWSLGMMLGIGNTAVQILWGTLAALAMYSGGHATTFDKSISLIAPLIILYIAYKIYTAEPDREDETKILPASAYLKAFGIGAILTFVAPQRVLLYLSVFAGFGVHYTFSSWTHIIPLVVGIVVGAFVWWLVVTGIVATQRKRMNVERLRILNKVGGILLVILAFAAFASFFAH